MLFDSLLNNYEVPGGNYDVSGAFIDEKHCSGTHESLNKFAVSNS